jgi:hypothetical protein
MEIGDTDFFILIMFIFLSPISVPAGTNAKTGIPNSAAGECFKELN